MKKLLLAGMCALTLSVTGASAQNAQGQGGQPSAKSGGVVPGAGTVPGKTGDTVGNNSGASNRDRATALIIDLVLRQKNS